MKLVWSLRTKTGSWISSAITKALARPRTCGDSAAMTAARTFAGPSAPGRHGLRMAPVTTIGIPESLIRDSTNAVSSSVSVPCVSTTPTAPSSAAVRADSTTLTRCSTVIEPEPTCATCSKVSCRPDDEAPAPWPPSSPACPAGGATWPTTEPTSIVSRRAARAMSSPETLGDTPPDSVGTDAIVPPRAAMWILMPPQ